MTGEAAGGPSRTIAGGPLTGDTTLEVADGLSLARVTGVFHVSIGRPQLRGDRYTLPILDVFARPRTVKDGLEDGDRSAFLRHGPARAS